MSYPTIKALTQLWDLFKEATKSYIDSEEYHLAEIQKVMTAESVIDLSMHTIYIYADYVHHLTSHLLNLRNHNLSKQWLELLQSRNQTPLIVKHDQRLDGKCTFDSALQMMEGKPYGFKEVQMVDPENVAEFKAAVEAMNDLDRLAQGQSFAGLPWMGNIVLFSMLGYKDTLCFVAKDKNNEIIGYAWGILLRDVPAGEKDKVNVFWVMNLARKPGFYDSDVKVGALLRNCIAENMKTNPECHFVGYQHILNNHFHLVIVDGGLPKEKEKINLGNVQYQATSELAYNPAISFVQSHVIKPHNHELAFPKYEPIESAVFGALWKAAPTAKDFIIGGLFFYGRAYYQKWMNSLQGQPIQYRIEKPVSPEQQVVDMKILKTIISSEAWAKQGTTWFLDSCIPSTMQKLQKLIENPNCDFSELQKAVADYGWSLSRSKLTAYFYLAMTQNASPTAVIDMLTRNQVTPKQWIGYISEERQLVANHQHLQMS